MQPDPNTAQSSITEKKDPQHKLIELAQFLKGPQPDLIRVNSIIPSTNFGIVISFTLGKTIAITEEGDKVVNSCTSDGSAIRNLARSLDLMSKKDRKKHKDVVRNLKAVSEYLDNPLNWGDQLNTGRES